MKYRGNIDLQGNQIFGLLAEDIPDLDASILTSGTISPARLSGTYAISITGTATSASTSSSAVKLQTARTIAGTAFDGTANIDISYTNLINVPSAFPTYLGSLTVDLNTLTSGDGWYHQSVNGNATLALNYPVTKAGKLEVRSPSAMYTYQTYHVYDGSGVYQRAYYNSSWSNWQRQIDTGNITAADIPNLDAAKIVSGVFPSARLSGTYAISISGTAATATVLATSRTISLTGDATGSASFNGSANAPITVTLANSGVTAGQYSKVTVDAKGRVTAGTTLAASDIPTLPWSKITSTPTTLSGYGITDAQPLSSELTGLAGLSSNGSFAGLVTRTGANTYTIRSIMPGQGISIDNGEGATDNIFVNNTGVLSITGTTDQVNAVRVGGTVYLSTPQSIATTSSPSFAQVTVSSDPSTATQVATKQYVDNIASGLKPKGSVRVATTANITLSGTQTIDGFALSVGDLVLVKNQTAQATNGIYVVASGTWSRATMANTWNSLVAAQVVVEQGTINADTGWVCTVDQGGTLGSTAVTWVQFFGTGTITAGAGITVTGTQVALTPSGVTAGAYAKVNVDTYGRVTSGATLVAADIPNLDAAKITTGTIATGLLSGTYNISISGTAANATQLNGLAASSYLSSANKAAIGDSQAGTDDTKWMSPLQTWNAFKTLGLGEQLINLTQNVDLNTLRNAGTRWYYAPSTATNIPVASQAGYLLVEDISSNYTKQTFTIMSGTGQGTEYIRTYVSGTWSGWKQSAFTTDAITGNAATATKLQTARTINGVAFDGTSNITITSALGPSGVTAGTYPKVTVDATGVVTAGTTLVAADIPSLDAAKITTGTLTVGTSGNAATATKLQTARTIGGVSFDGTANINLPGVNTAGNQNTTGNAATATKLATPVNINGVAFDGSAAITVADSTKVAKAGDTMTGELISTSANSYRQAIGNYGTFWRNDANTYYMMLTNSGDALGSWNSFRPLSVTLATGAVSIGAQGLTIPGATTMNSSLTIVNGTGEMNMKPGSSGGYFYGNASAIGLYMPTGGANIQVTTSNTINVGGATTFANNITCNGTAYCGNWWRSTGGTGWYNETYGGGIYMVDTTWVRVYNSKGFLVSNDIISTGNITAYYSDERLKENLQPITNALGILKKWTGYRYNANELAESFGYDRSKKEVGLLAQDVQKDFPELVSRAPFDIAEDKNSSKSGEDYLTLHYDRAVPVLVEGIKELDDVLEATLDRVDNLENEVAELKALIQQLIQNKVG